MVRARIFLALAFLAAILVAAATMPDTGNAAPSVGCADLVYVDASAVDGCPGCKGEGDRADDLGGTACAALCAAMTAVLPAPTHIVPAAPRSTRGLARPVPSGIPVAPERAPPRPSIHA